MNAKRIGITAVAVWIFFNLYGWLVYEYVLAETMLPVQNLFRPEATMEGFLIWLLIGTALEAAVFVYIFAKGYENKGLAEGLRFGALFGIFWLGVNAIFYAIQPFPADIILKTGTSDFVNFLLAGAVAALVYGKLKEA